MKKIILASAGALVLLGSGVGSTLAYMQMKHPAGPPKPPPPKPLYFAELDDLVVSVPVDSTGQSYVQFSVQFASTDQQAVATFSALQPIVKAETINLLMSATAKQLMDPSTHTVLAKHCLSIANQVLDNSAAYTPPNPFTAAYITNIVQQD